MIKFLKKSFSIINFQLSIVIALLMLPIAVQANTNSEYSLTKYHIDIKVNENNTFQITEQIRAQFNVRKHGINREIPIWNEVVRLDGTKSQNWAKTTDVSVEGDMYKLFNSDVNRVIQIGNPDLTITGSKDYVITYLYNIGKDPVKDYDELYLNLIGNQWDTSIDSITFTITMPKAFDSSTLGFSSGAFGATDNDKISYEVNGLVISGSYDGQLGAGEALTVRLELPEGYFVGASYGNSNGNSDTMMYLSFVLPICFLLIVLGMWYVYGRDEMVIDAIEFYPPEGYNSAETGFLYKGKVEAQDVVSLLIYLANKGYVKITETQEKSRSSKRNGFIITKLKDYDGDNPNERLFLKGLFKYSVQSDDTASGEEEVRLEDLKDKFYTTLKTIVSNLNKKENKLKIFEKSSLNKAWLVVPMVLATFFLITVQPTLDFFGDTSYLFTLLFPIIGFVPLYFVIFTNKNGKPTTGDIVKIVFFSVFALLFSGVSLVGIVLPALLLKTVYWVAFLIGMICIVTMLILGKNMKKRTKLGNELLGKIKGFKRFLETAEKNKLEMLVRQTPDYFYDILPFTYVLGVSEIWIKKFESIAIQQPKWYSGSSAFSHAAFGSFMTSTMKSASSAMASSPSSSSSGGGSSGRGSGGGGGSSW